MTQPPRASRPSLLVRLGAGIAALAVGLGLGAGLASAGLGAQWLAAEPEPEPTQVAVPAASMPPQSPRTCSIAERAGAADALAMHGLIENAQTGEVLFDYRSTETTPTASVMKLITAATALHVLGPETRFETRVYPATEPGAYVLVGGGDPTLRAGDGSVYRGAPGIDELANQLRAHDSDVRTVGYDDSLFGGEGWLTSWHEHDRTDGAIGDVSALMVDAGRADARTHYSPRSKQPSEDAVNAFAARLNVPASGRMSPKPGSQPVATVKSPTVRELVRELLLNSDNLIGEALARHVAIKLGTGSDFAAISAAQQQALTELDIPTDGFVGADGSGMSRDNRASAATVMAVIEQIQLDAYGLGELVEYLPENQRSGTLKHRLDDIPTGAVAAKTGWTDEVFALAGFMTLADGTTLRFAVFVAVPPGSDTPTTSANREALDAIVTQVYRCGVQLSGEAPA